MAKGYPLMPLLNLRRLRRDKAVHRVRTWELQLVQAKKDVAAAVKKHEDFLAWLVREEARRYDKIMGTDMSLEDLEDFKAGLLDIRGRETGFLERIIRAKQRRETCETGLEEAKAALVKAQKDTLKIEMHREKWHERMRQEEERAQELELEEYRIPAAMPA